MKGAGDADRNPPELVGMTFYWGDGDMDGDMCGRYVGREVARPGLVSR